MSTRRRRRIASPYYLAAALSTVALPAALANVAGAHPATESSGPQKSGKPAVVSSRKQSPAPSRPAAPALPKPSVTAGAAAPLRPNALLPSEYMPVSQLREGMTGYGLTVFRGNKIDRFDVTILGVMRKVYNGRDLILVKLGGPNMKRLTGIAHGMSGSPVYVNGRLVGAVSMGSQFTREPIGYVTPIESMLDAWDPAIPQYSDILPSHAPKVASLEHPVTVEGRRYTQVAFLPPGSTSSAAQLPPGTLDARPAMTRIMVSGVAGSRFKGVAETLAKWGLDAAQGPGGGSGGGNGIKAAPLIPGGTVGMSLATGDIDLTATGTVTYRRGNRLLAFGHPFLGIGPLAAPMFTAYVHDMEPSYADSSMIASPVDLIGSFSQDRPFSVAGTVGAKPVMVPITVHVNDKTMGSDRIFHARLIQHPQLTPTLTGMAADAAISEVHGQPGDAMATVTTTVTADEVGSVTHTNRVFDSQEIDTAALGDLQSLMNLLSANPFYPVAVRDIKMDVTIEPGRKTAQVERIFLRQTRYEPGDTVEIGVVLKPYKQDRVTRTLKLRIPPATPSGTLPLTVQGGQSFGGLRLGGITLVPSGGSDYANAATVKQLARKWEERDRNDTLVARLALPASAVSIQGEKLPDLPPNLDAAMRGGANGTGLRSSGVRIERDEVKTTEETPYVLSGGQTLSIRVERRAQATRPYSGGYGDSYGAGGADTSSSDPSASGGTGGSSGTSSGTPNGFLSVPVSPDDLAARPGVPSRQQAAPVEPAGDSDDPADSGITTIHVSVAPPRTGLPPAIPSASLPARGSLYSSQPSANSRSVGRAPGIWRQAGALDFRAGTLNGVTVTSLGDIRLAPKLAKVAESAEPYFWSLAPDGTDAGGVYAGSGDGGIVYHAGPDGNLSPFAQTGELEVHSLVRAADGTLYAGTSPHGRIFRIGASGGKASLLCEMKEKYILALALSPDGGTLYAATGGGAGKVYALPVSGTGDPVALYEGGETNVTSLAVAGDGALYAGTAPNGLVVKVSGPGVSHPSIVYDAAEPSISGLAVTKDGTVYAATSPRGMLYRLAPNASPEIVFDGSSVSGGGGGLSNLQISADGATLYTASGSTLVAVDTSGGPARTFDAASDIQILSVLLAPGGVWASTGNSAGLYRLNGAATEGQFVSPVLDARANARWGELRWTSSGESVSLETRSGDTSEPDSTWSDWNGPYVSASGQPVKSPAARYFQYRANLKGPANGGVTKAPVLSSVELFYQTPNRAPQVTLLTPRGGEVLHGATGTVRWSGFDPDRDTLLYEISVSGDGGKTWTPLRSAHGGRPSFTALAAAPPSSARNAAAAPASSQAEVQQVSPSTSGQTKTLMDLQAELDRHPEISPEMRARILAGAPTGNAGFGTSPIPSATADAAPPTAPTRETSLPFDTTALPDGTYLLRVSASDRPSNPAGSLSAEKVSGEFRIANRPPSLVLFQKEIVVAKDRTVHIEGIALHPDAGVAIRGVQYRIDSGSASPDSGGDWMAAPANDGLFDSDAEGFTLTTAPLSPGKHIIEVQALDEAGNVAVQKATVVVK